MQSTYTALNGREVREITKRELGKAIDALPYLREGNSFHRAKINFGFTMTAYPADVPVPEKDFEFEMDSATAVSPEAIKQFKESAKLEEQIQLLSEERDRLEVLLDEAIKHRAAFVNESEEVRNIDGEFPDQARIEADMPVPVIQHVKGKTIETTVPAAQFRKVS